MRILTIKNRLSKINEEALFTAPQMTSFLQIIFASCFIAICAQIKIPLYFTPIPLTIQTVAVMLVGGLLGSRQATLAIVCYIFQGCIGLPVWAGGASGLLHFIGPTGGYIMAYLLQAFLIGWFIERQNNPSLAKIGAVCLLSICLQLGIGSIWLAQFVGMNHCFELGFYPFFLGEVMKASFVATYIKVRK